MTATTRSSIDRALAQPKRSKLLNPKGTLVAWWAPVKQDVVEDLAHDPHIAVRNVKKGNHEVTEALVKNDLLNITGEYVIDARVGSDARERPCVEFTLNEDGGKRFSEMTGSHLPDLQVIFHYRLGIIIDDVLYTAPLINSVIERRGEITGSFTNEEVRDMAMVLNCGSLPVKVRPVAASGAAEGGH